MKEPEENPQPQRQELLREIEQLARLALFGTISETCRTCGNPACRCHRGGPKHGPHLYVSYRGAKGKTTGYYVPKAIQEEVREGVAAWRRIQEALQQISALNKEKLMETRNRKKRTSATGSS